MDPNKMLQQFMMALEKASQAEASYDLKGRNNHVDEALLHLDGLQEWLANGGTVPPVSVDVNHVNFVHVNLGEKK